MIETQVLIIQLYLEGAEKQLKKNMLQDEYKLAVL